MERNIKSMEEKYLLPAAQLVQAVFTDHESAEEGRLVQGGLAEIRGEVSYRDYQALR